MVAVLFRFLQSYFDDCTIKPTLSKQFYILFYNLTQYHKYLTKAFAVPCKHLLNDLKYPRILGHF